MSTGLEKKQKLSAGQFQSNSWFSKQGFFNGFAGFGLVFFLVACSPGNLNNPYAESEAKQNQHTLYSSFSISPKHLDPAKSYTSDEATFTYQIYEPLYQYHYLKRPYTLTPLAATDLPSVEYKDKAGNTLQQKPANDDEIVESIYTIKLQRGIKYQPHPAFVKGQKGQYLYHDLGEQAENYKTPNDFQQHATRELTAHDYVYEIKRLASPRVVSPVFGHFSAYIVGLADLAEQLSNHDDTLKKKRQTQTNKIITTIDLPWLDLRQMPFEGATALDDYTLQIRVKGVYPQFVYWLAMPFFAPIPWEADRFYWQPGFEKNNLILDKWPVGTGPYMLTENDPNLRMILSKNPNFRGEPYPSAGEPNDKDNGLLADAGKTMPFIERVVFTLEKEGIPYWNKFLQGYYDSSGLSSDTFDQAILTSTDGSSELTDDMKEKQIRLETSLSTSLFYLGFNWLDPVVGGAETPELQERNRLLRQAIAIAVDWEEYAQIFTNGRVVPAHGPVVPGLFGHEPGQAGWNTHVYNIQNGKPVRKPITEAFALLKQAGYEKGIDPKTGRPLTLALDTTGGGPGDKARLDWYRKQFGKLNIQLEIRPTDWNRFQEKIRKGSTQIFFLGWNADYPDPENFLFLLYGKNARAKNGGENASNYSNPEYDRLFNQMKTMENSPERAEIISKMTDLLQKDAPWLFAFIPKNYGLIHDWYQNIKPNTMARNDIKYKKINVDLREKKRQQWNQPVWLPIAAILVLLVLFAFPAYVSFQRREKAAGVRRDLAKQYGLEKGKNS